MSNDQQGCCIIEVCCGAETLAGVSPKQTQALATVIQLHSDVTAAQALTIATYLCGRFDFAPKWSLRALKDYVRTEALLHPDYNGD